MQERKGKNQMLSVQLVQIPSVNQEQCTSNITSKGTCPPRISEEQEEEEAQRRKNGKV